MNCKDKSVNVLSTFDGMSCGRIALERAGISVEKYYASELDKYAIKVTQANYPATIQLGDVTKWRDWDIDWSGIDLLIGGSPCQGFSFAGKQLAFDDPRSKLFFVYVDILNHIRSVNPSVKFLLENVKMKKEFLDIISEQLGVQPVFIHSALLSAQNRQRFYWANWEFGQPEDKGIVLADIIEDGEVDRDKSYCIDANYHKGGNPEQYFNKSRRQLVFNPAAIRGRYLVDGKRQDGKMLTAGLTQQMLEVKADQKTNALTTVQKDNVITTMKPGRYPLIDLESSSYSDRCKRQIRKNSKTIDQKSVAVCTNSNMTGSGSNVLDYGFGLYRKLTPVECERLQTVPDNYTAHVSNTQRYRMLGNGWTVDVIAHILRGLRNS